ncbi:MULTISPECIES: hypothetical protein [unclassified Pseudomonas]|uniref:hypothetical protein n=1 Tax=unclassified Pseudomonas TaxID=196821 RepID=UPI0024470EF1|nr:MULTISPECIES: hypothetical protein [unclassified Pseudomonas]MDH0301509.1 hypothetical protein [Pseudomonas sp. GD04091]MDH1985403.1 hypothetical protein [Pseudomonas sp. GD03689]
MGRLSLAIFPLLLTCAQPVLAEQARTDQGCIDVQVGQSRALAYDCLTQQLQGSDPRAAKGLRERLDPVQQLQRKAPSQMGLATPAATSTRMGNSFGSSVVPQRP